MYNSKVQHQRSEIGCGCFRYGYGACQFSVSICDEEDKLIIVGRLLEWSKKVNGDAVKGDS